MKKILVLDIETTGFLRDGGSIVEIGIVELDLDTGDTKIVYDSLLREDILTAKHREYPFGWVFRNSDLKVDDVRNARKADEVLKEVQYILDKYPLGVTAYNKKFDFDFLRDRGLDFKELPCPMMIATDVCKIPGPYGYKWPSVEESYKRLFPDEKYEEKHRGADDALHEAKIVYELYKKDLFKLD